MYLFWFCLFSFNIAPNPRMGILHTSIVIQMSHKCNSIKCVLSDVGIQCGSDVFIDGCHTFSKLEWNRLDTIL